MCLFALSAYYLPKDDEYYQFCYVDQDGQIRGASVPFQFRTEIEDDMLVITKEVSSAKYVTDITWNKPFPISHVSMLNPDKCVRIHCI